MTLPTVKDVISLPAHRIAASAIRNGGNASLTISYAPRRSFEPLYDLGPVHIDVQVGDDTGTVLVTGSTTPLRLNRRILLGGAWRWFFTDPSTGSVVANLYWYNGVWGSRAWHRLTYPCQRQTSWATKLRRWGAANRVWGSCP